MVKRKEKGTDRRSLDFIERTGIAGLVLKALSTRCTERIHEKAHDSSRECSISEA